ncbi:hypothetical protein [Pseudodesulfovibrio sp.]|uniref:hypothetical protein n=1 Tax=unclassified Pseudodesulfovibrio TaxID=2661612 RepID=UPI003B004994
MRGCLAGLLAFAVLFSGCASLGPSRVSRDRVEYNRSITDSWKRQILLNIVKIRYVEPLFFMSVGEIVTSYSMETGGTLGVSQTLYSNPNNSASTLIELGGSAKYTDRPTITYRPLTGNDFFRGIMSPMPLRNVLASVQSGASVEFLFRLGVRSINGLRNESLAADGFKQAEEGFSRAVNLLNRLQAQNAMWSEFAQRGRNGPTCS